MKSFFKNITAFTFTFIVLLSTVSFTVSMHYCGDTLVDAALFGKAESCGMEAMEMKKDITQKCSITKKDCCNEKQVIIKGQDDLKVDSFVFTATQQLFFTAYFYTYLNRFEAETTQFTPFQNYIPPLVVKDIHKLDESYLI